MGCDSNPNRISFNPAYGSKPCVYSAHFFQPFWDLDPLEEQHPLHEFKLSTI
jgi:hypothetical protein